MGNTVFNTFLGGGGGLLVEKIKDTLAPPQGFLGGGGGGGLLVEKIKNTLAPPQGADLSPQVF